MTITDKGKALVVKMAIMAASSYLSEIIEANDITGVVHSMTHSEKEIARQIARAATLVAHELIVNGLSDENSATESARVMEGMFITILAIGMRRPIVHEGRTLDESLAGVAELVVALT
jgi:hypothetical protein